MVVFLFLLCSEIGLSTTYIDIGKIHIILSYHPQFHQA